MKTMPVLEFAMNKRRVMLGAACAAFLVLVFTAFAIGVFVNPGSRESTIGIVIFCALMDVLGVWGLRANIRKLRDRSPQLLLDQEGVTDRTLSTPKFPWSSILSARPIRQSRSGITYMALIAITVSDEEQRLAQLTPGDRRLLAASRALGGESFNINLTNLPITREEFMAYMNEARVRAGLTPLLLETQ